MKFRVEVLCISDAGQEQRCGVLEMERRQLAMETLGLNLCESKAMLGTGLASLELETMERVCGLSV